MSIIMPTNFNVQTQSHIDTRLTQDNIAARDLISSATRYWGMQVHVLDSDGSNNPNTFILQKGVSSTDITDNGNWKKISLIDIDNSVNWDAAYTHSQVITGNPHAVTKTEVGLSNVQNLDQTNASNLSSGTISSTLLPPIALTTVTVVADEVEQLALVAEEGDVAVRSDQNKSYMQNAGVAGTMADWTELQTPTDTVLSVFTRTGTVTAQSNDYTWAQIDKTVSDIANITTRSHSSLTSIGSNTHAQIDTHLGLTSAHIDWTSDQGATNIHSGNYTNTTYSTNQVLDWTVDLGAINIHSGNYTNSTYSATLTAGTGLSGTTYNPSTSTTFALNFAELTAGGTLIAGDYLIAENGGVENRQLISSIPLSIFNNDLGGGTIGGSIANTQVAYGTAADTIGGGSSLVYDGSGKLGVGGAYGLNAIKAYGYVEVTNGIALYPTSGTKFTFDVSSTDLRMANVDGARDELWRMASTGQMTLNKQPTTGDTTDRVLMWDATGAIKSILSSSLGFDDTNVAYVNATEAISGTWNINDNNPFYFGTSGDWSIAHNTGNEELQITAGTPITNGALHMIGVSSSSRFKFNIKGTNAGLLQVGTANATAGYVLELVTKGRGTDWTATSDRDLKREIKSYGDVLPKIELMDGFLSTYIRKDDELEQIELGMIAQEVKEIFPEIVSGDKSKGEFLDISYMRMGPIALQGIVELSEKNTILENRLIELEKLVEQLTK